MRIARFGIAVLLGAGILPGCVGKSLEAYKKYDLGDAEATIASAIESTGGLRTWKSVGRIRAKALMTIYEDDGRLHVNRQLHEININARKLTIKAASGSSKWQATYSTGWIGGFSLSNPSALEQLSADRLRGIMSVLLHRLIGPLNLLEDEEKPARPANVTVDGEDLIRVPVTGDRTMASAYYFDVAGGGLRMVADGSEKPGRKGTVTLYTYQMLPNGMLFPNRIRIVRTGEYVLVGKSTIVDVEYSDIVVD
jgi:hypothetical protein